MSCAESSSTDSGDRKPTTVPTFVAREPAVGGTCGWTGATVSPTCEASGGGGGDRRRSTGSHAASAARVMHRAVTLITAFLLGQGIDAQKRTREPARRGRGGSRDARGRPLTL